MFSFGLVDETGYLSNAGALLADECPMRWSRVFCTRWNGLDKSGGVIDALDDAEYSGSLISLMENSETFILRNTRKMWRKTPNSREEMPEYAERSYHEALINALVHRDNLIIGSEIHLDIFDDRMEIYSPGGMPDGTVIQDRDPLTVPSTRRNPLVADVFERLGYMERRGSGFGKIIRSYEFQANYQEEKKPYFRSDRTQFTVILPNLNYAVTQDGTQDGTQGGTQGGTQDKFTERIIQIIRNNHKITIQEISNRTGVSVRTLKRRIALIPNIKYVGSGYSGHWEIVDD
jgi:Predicted transcriptional regulator containing an HTH domain and an uncharacterized domain shared with the mammalian protein Schlafen